MFNFPAVNFLLCLPAVCSVLQYFYQIYWTFQLFQPNLTPFHFFTVHKCSVFTWSFATKLVFNILDEQAFPPLATDRLCSSSPLLSCELGFLASSTCSTTHRRWVGPSHSSQEMGPSSGNSTHPSSSSISEKPHNWRLTCEGFKNKRGLYSFPVSMILPLLHDLCHMLIISLYNHLDEMTKTLYTVKSDAQGNESTVNDNPALKLHFKLFTRWS